MRHLKVNSKSQAPGPRTIGTRNAKEIPAKTAQNDRNNIGKRISAGSMPRTRRSATQANTPSSGAAKTTAVTSSIQNKIAIIQNVNDQPRSRGEMESLLKKRDETMPCMTGSDRVANWKSSQFAIDYYRNEVVVSPRRQSMRSIQKSSIQERISYGKVSSSTTLGDNSPGPYDFKVPTTMHRNDNSSELIDLTDDASESNTSSITTTQEELYSYLGVVTKSQTNKVEPETENKTVKRSSLRVKVKQIALRNQEIYNQLENNRKLEAANNAQSLVRYNGHRTDQQPSVQVKPHNGDPRLNHYISKHQQYTHTTYKSTTLVNNTTNSQSSRNNYQTVTTNRVSQQQHHHHLSSYQLVPYSHQSSRVRNTTNKCTVMERFVYKPQQQTETRPIQVNANKYKTAILSPTLSNPANHPTNRQLPIGSRPAKISPIRKPEMAPTGHNNRPPQITAGIKRKAMEQWIELNSSHPTRANNNVQSKPQSSSSSSFASSHHQNTITTTNIATHRKMQKLDVSFYVKNTGSTARPTSNTFQTNFQSNGNVSPQRKMQIDSRKSHVQFSTVPNTNLANGSPQQRTVPQNYQTKSARVVQSTTMPPIQSPPSRNIRPSNALTLQTYSQKNIGNNRVSKRRISPKFSSEMKKAIIHQAHTMQNVVVVNNVMTPKKVQTLNSRSVPPGKVYLPHTTNKDNISPMQINQQRNIGNNSTHKFTTYDPRVSSSSSPITQNIAVSKVSSIQASSKQYITNSANDVAIEVTVRSNFNSKRATSMQMRAIENIETPGNASEKNTQKIIDNKKFTASGDVKNVDLNKRLTVQLTQLRPMIPNSPSNSHHNAKSSTSSIATPVAPKQNSASTALQLLQSHSMQNILLLPTSSMESKNAFQPPMFDIQSEIEIASTDLNENVESKPDIPIDLSSSISDGVEVKIDSKTDSMEDVKPCVTIVDATSMNASDCADSKPLEIIESVESTKFLLKRDGDVLSVLCVDKQLAVIQERLISLWTQSSDLLSIFGVAQQYDCIGKIERYNCDIEIDTPSYQQRLLVVGNETFYVELRARKLIGAYTRESLMSVYLTLYALSDQQELILRHIDLDRVHGSIPSIRYTILPKSRSFVISWSEVVTNIRKYNLSSSMLKLESVHIFPGCREPLKKLQFFENDTVIAFGNSTITMWDSRSGDITCKIDTSTSIGDNLHFFSLNENAERALFLIQSCVDQIGSGQLIKLLAINMNNNYSYKVICTHKMPSNKTKITSMATMANHFMATYENGQSFLLNLHNPRQFVVRSSDARGSKCFATNDKIIAIDYNQFISKTFVDHFFG